jgi:hypothetical protein
LDIHEGIHGVRVIAESFGKTLSFFDEVATVFDDVMDGQIYEPDIAQRIGVAFH